MSLESHKIESYKSVGVHSVRKIQTLVSNTILKVQCAFLVYMFFS